MNNVTAIFTLLSIAPEGEEKALTLAVGVPYRREEGAWACPVALQGLYEELPDVVGMNSWHALNLALALLHRLLAHYIAGGGRLLWQHEDKEAGKEMYLSDLFPQFRIEH